MDREDEPYEKTPSETRRRREDKHPVLGFLAKAWIGLSTVASISMAGFLALGFEFKTPASWLQQTQVRLQSVETEVAGIKTEARETNELLGILARDACSRFTREQLRVTPKCDQYVRNR